MKLSCFFDSTRAAVSSTPTPVFAFPVPVHFSLSQKAHCVAAA